MAAAAFALLFAGLAVSPVESSELGAMKLMEENSMAAEELETFASCTWPFDPYALDLHLSAPKGHFLIEDKMVVIALALSIMLGSLAMHMDFLDLDDQGAKRTDAACSGSYYPSYEFPTTAWLLVIVFGVALQIMSVDDAPLTCQRLPLLVARPTSVLALSRHAIEELLRLPSGGQHPALMDDATGAATLLAFFLLGIVIMRVDVREMSEDRDGSVVEESSSQDESESSSPESCLRREAKPNRARSRSVSFEDEVVSSGKSSASGAVCRIVLGFATLPLVLLIAIGNGLLCAWLAQELWPQADHPLPSLSGPLLNRAVQLCAPAVSDPATVLCMALFVFLGFVPMHADFISMREQDENAVSEPDPPADHIKTSMTKASRDASLLQFLTKQWRMMTCVVLLISMCGAAAAMYWEGVM